MAPPALPPALLTLAVLAGCAGPPQDAPAAGWSGAIAAAVDAIGERSVQVDGMVGVSIGVAIDGRVVYARGFGHADAARTIPATADTIYDVASVGKQFTAAAVLRLVEDGRLGLDDRIRGLVPGLPPQFPDATVEQLLRHTSGYLAGGLDELDPPEDYARPRYGAELLTDVELQSGHAGFRPGETWNYCNPGYLVLGMAVESASGRRYDRYLREEVLGPAGLGSILVCEYAPLPEGSQRIHRADGGLAPVPYIDMTAWSGQGSICASVVDLLRWSRALDEGRILSPSSLALMRAPSPVRGEVATAQVPYGMGQRLGRLGGVAKVGHTGTFDGGSAALYLYPDAGLEIAVVTNTRGDGTPHASTVEREIAKLVLGLPRPDVAAQRSPVTAEQRRAVEGRYANRREFTARIEGDELVVLQGGEVQERLLHVGGLRFRSAADPDVHEWFLMDGERAGWWVYSSSGSYVEVLRRVR